MKIAWFTPFCKTSAIGRVSKAVVEALSQQPNCVVDVWTHQREDLQLSRQALRQFDSRTISARDLRTYDHLIYNLGNYPAYHLPIFETAQRHPGVVILHDQCMHHFFAGFYLDQPAGAEKYLNAIDELYGAPAREKAARGLKSGSALHESAEVIDYPFWEPCVSRARAVVVHSDYGADIVRAKCHLPIATPSLPHGDYGNLGNLIPAIDRGAIADDGKIHLLTLGHVNPNKRIHVVLEVLGKNPDLKKAVMYHVIGPLQHQAYEKTLRGLVVRHGLESTVEFLGYQTDDVLYQHLCKANICVNLRYPAFETGSASLIEAMYFGLPTIATDTGAYRDMPESCLRRIPIAGEHECLEKTLQTLVADADQRRTLSRNAQQHIRQHCTAEAYSKKLLDLLGLLSHDPNVGAKFLGKIQNTLLGLGEVRGGGASKKIAAELARFWP